METLQPLFLSLKLALVTTFILLVVCIPLARVLIGLPSIVRAPLTTLFAMPLVLPPSVLGFYLLVFLSPEHPVGGWLGESLLGIKAFTFSGLVFGSTLYSLPFVLQPLVQAFSDVSGKAMETAASLGASPLDRFLTVMLPLAWRGVATGAVLGFAHTLGEFGVILFIGGNIPGETRVASIAIYDHVEALQFDQAHQLSWILLGFSFLTLTLFGYLQKGRTQGA